MLAEMKERGEGFYHYAKRMSLHHYQYYKKQTLPDDKVTMFEQLAADSIERQKQIEQTDNISFDDYLAAYYAQSQ